MNQDYSVPCHGELSLVNPPHISLYYICSMQFFPLLPIHSSALFTSFQVLLPCFLDLPYVFFLSPLVAFFWLHSILTCFLHILSVDPITISVDPYILLFTVLKFSLCIILIFYLLTYSLSYFISAFIYFVIYFIKCSITFSFYILVSPLNFIFCMTSCITYTVDDVASLTIKIL